LPRRRSWSQSIPSGHAITNSDAIQNIARHIQRGCFRGGIDHAANRRKLLADTGPDNITIPALNTCLREISEHRPRVSHVVNRDDGIPEQNRAEPCVGRVCPLSQRGSPNLAEGRCYGLDLRKVSEQAVKKNLRPGSRRSVRSRVLPPPAQMSALL